MKLQVIKKETYTSEDTIVFFLSEEEAEKPDTTKQELFATLEKDITLDYFKGKKSETQFYPLSGGPNLLLCGLGKKSELSFDDLRIAGGAAVSMMRELSLNTAKVVPPAGTDLPEEDVLRTLGEGAYLSNYAFNRYKSKQDEPEKPVVSSLKFITGANKGPAIAKETEIIAGNVLKCRDMVNDISEQATSVNIAKEASKISGKNNLTCTVYGKTEIKKMKMGLLLAVNQGSSIPPQFVVLKYAGNPKSRKCLALVGKGVTFDSGGVNLKPTGNIETMRQDMAGAAAVLYTLKTVSELKLKKNVYGVIPLTDNMLNSNAYRPGDVFTGYNGKTVEIGNTDAEGRLILADALAYTTDKLKPEYIIDVATLTGACVATFGETIAAYLANDDEIGSALEKASENTGEKIWKMPLYDEFDESLKSDIADIVNISSDRKAGTIIGATFLKNFIGESRWGHIDIAGTAWFSKARGYHPKNATGFGVRLLTESVKLL